MAEPMTWYRSGPTRVNSGCEELIRPPAEVRLYPAAISTRIISCRVKSRRSAVSTITRYRAGTAVPGGGCQEPSGEAVAPTPVSPAARPVADKRGPGTEPAGPGDRSEKGVQGQRPDRGQHPRGRAGRLQLRRRDRRGEPRPSLTGRWNRCGQPESACGPDPRAVVIAGNRAPRDLGDHLAGQRDPGTGAPHRRDPVRHGPGRHAVPGRDLRQAPRRVPGQAVIVKHDPDTVGAQRPEHPIRQLRQHLGGGPSRQWYTVTHPVTLLVPTRIRHPPQLATCAVLSTRVRCSCASTVRPKSWPGPSSA